MMRVPLVRQAILTGVCVCIVSGCSYPHAGPELPEGATSADVAPATPPPVLAKQPSVPAASPTYPTGHPSLRPSTAEVKPTPPPAPTPISTSSARASATGHHSPGLAPASPANTPGRLEAVLPDAGATAAAAAPASESAPPKTDAGSSFENLELADASLKGKLAILRVGSEPSANDLLSVFAGLKNKTAHPLALQVQTIYKDKAGDSLNTGSWIPMTLKPHEETEYRSTSISGEAVDFLIRVRLAQVAGAAGAN